MADKNHPSLNCATMEEYQSDPRIACKYNVKCYQENSVHINKYKHPPRIANPKRKRRPATKKICAGAGRPLKPSKAADDAHISDDSSSEPNSPKRKAVDAQDPQEDSSSNNNILSSPSGTVSHSEACINLSHAFDDEEEMPPSPSDIRLNIQQKFLFEMPEDFYSFWDLCKSLNSSHPLMAFKDVGLRLVGPYEVLAGDVHLDNDKRKQSLFLLHWRYYYDPPEFQTVLKGDDDKLFHVGYFRDDPKSLPVFLASNCAAKDGVFSQLGENIFGAVNSILSDMKKSANPFLQSKIQRLQKTLQEHANENDFTLETKTQAMKARNRKTVSKTFNGLGLLVPVEKKTEVGYRELIESDANLKRILNKVVNSDRQEDKDKAFDQLQQVITAANIANDECDFGTSVELGLDLFAFGGSELEQSALQLLSTGYSLLGRKEFSKIARVHINHRRKGANLDMFDGC